MILLRRIRCEIREGSTNIVVRLDISDCYDGASSSRVCNSRGRGITLHQLTIEPDVLLQHAVLREHLQGALPGRVPQGDCARWIIEYLAHAGCEGLRVTRRKLQPHTVHDEAETANVRADEQTACHHLLHRSEWCDVLADRRHHESGNTLQH